MKGARICKGAVFLSVPGSGNTRWLTALCCACKCRHLAAGEKLDLDKERKIRSQEEMAEEAQTLRKYFEAHAWEFVHSIFDIKIPIRTIPWEYEREYYCSLIFDIKFPIRTIPCTDEAPDFDCPG
jgi:hypothetical protein